jgi:hypothetical protein
MLVQAQALLDALDATAQIVHFGLAQADSRRQGAELLPHGGQLNLDTGDALLHLAQVGSDCPQMLKDEIRRFLCHASFS